MTNDIAMALRTHAERRRNQDQIWLCVGFAAAKARRSKCPVSVSATTETCRDKRLLRSSNHGTRLFTLIQAELRRSGFEDLIPAGIVLTGGTSKMEGVVELAEEIFHMPVSIGKPKSVAGLSDIVKSDLRHIGRSASVRIGQCPPITRCSPQ